MQPMLKPMNEGPLLLNSDPFQQLQAWLDEAKAAQAPEPTAMTLATASKDGVPSARIVLFKGVSKNSTERDGVEFFTNYESKKSKELISNPCAALVFYWNILRRQVRLEGVVKQVSREESERYFQTRRRDSQIGAWSSPQSHELKSREDLVEKVESTKKKFGSGPIPCPPFWGGWRLTPSRFEFWEERPHRLHERHEMKFESGVWRQARLAP